MPYEVNESSNHNTILILEVYSGNSPGMTPHMQTSSFPDSSLDQGLYYRYPPHNIIANEKLLVTKETVGYKDRAETQVNRAVLKSCLKQARCTEKILPLTSSHCQQNNRANPRQDRACPLSVKCHAIL